VPSRVTPTPARLLLLSNSRDAAGRYLEHPRQQIRQLLGDGVREVLFVPFAAVTVDADAYAERVRGALAPLGYALRSVHETPDPAEAVRAAQAIAVGGGNTFHLLHRLYETGLLGVIRGRVRAGVPYLGWSAGSVVACPTIQTTNDMPIVMPRSALAFAFVPFQINAHYTDFHPPGFQGETRAERLREFVEVNPGAAVIGLPEGTMLRVEGDAVELIAAGVDAAAPVFRKGRQVRYHRPGEPLDALLDRG
jgi:dipeptidase E